jgi:ribonuclease P protein component
MVFAREWRAKAAAGFSRRGARVAASGSAPDRGTPSVVVERLKRRSDFRAAAKGMRAGGRAFALQALQRAADGAVRVGVTVSRQVGSAVERNRVRRRLREMVRLSADVGADPMCPGYDYVLIGRRAALAAPFGLMMQEFNVALARIHERGHPSERRGTGGVRRDPLHEAGPQSGPKKRRGRRRKPSA